MDDFAARLARARDELGPSWDERRAMELYAGVGQRRRRRTVRRAAATTLTVCAAALLLVTYRDEIVGTPVASNLPSAPSTPTAAVEPSPEPPALAVAAPSVRTMRLSDGSAAELLGEGTELAIVRDADEAVDVDLVSGRARFDVVGNAARTFTVQAAEVRVVVLGTRFVVERLEASVRVEVEQGEVRVESDGRAAVLVAGDARDFASTAVAAPAPERPRARAAAPVESWRALGQSGNHDAAWALLEKGVRVGDDPAALMDAADAARLSGHARGAIGYLETIVRKHATSPLAPLAAFTLGRLQLDELGEPGAAAAAFAKARALAPQSSLAQDALAREVEALAEGGRPDEAHLRAREYVERYPDGRRLKAVKLHGNLE